MGCWLEAVYARRLWARVAWYAGMAALFVAAILALRREYILSISACFAWGTFTLPLGLRKITSVALVAGLFVLGYAVVLAVPEWRHRLFNETVDTFEAGQDPRLLMLQTSPKLFAEQPLTGFGLGAFPMLMASSLPLHFATVDEANRFSAFGLASHNSFLTAALETGVVGLIGVILLISWSGIWSVRIWRANRFAPGNPLAHFAPIFFIQIFFSVFFQDGLASNVIWSYLALLIAIIAVERSKLGEIAAMRRRARIAARHSLPGRGEGGPDQPPRKNVRNPRMG